MNSHSWDALVCICLECIITVRLNRGRMVQVKLPGKGGVGMQVVGDM